MAQQTINVGTAPNDGTGTPLRTAFQYTNSNFTELYTATGPSGNNITVPGNATITGDLTVDTNTLKVDSANNRVGVGTATPVATLQSNGTLTISGGTAASTANGLHLYFNTGTNTATISAFHSGVDNRDLAIDGKTIGFSLAGSTAMTLNSTGLGIGASPSDKLTVSGGASFTAFAINANPINFTGTSQSFARFRNAGGDFYYGIEGSVGGTFFTGSTAYAACFLTGNTPIQFITNGALRATIDTSGNLILQSSATPATLTTNGQLTVNATSNTNLRFSYRGSDGVTRVANLTLA